MNHGSVPTIRHCHEKIAKAFSESRVAHAEQNETALRHIREDMDKAWKVLGEGWQDVEERLIEIGIVKAASCPQEFMVSLNIGGVPVHIRRLVLEGQTLGDLFEGVWDERVPRDGVGRIVIDESPMCVKYLIDALKKNAGDVRVLEPYSIDEKGYLDYISGIICCKGPQAISSVPRDELVLPHSKVSMVVPAKGGTVLTELELIQVMIHARKSSWFPGDPHKLELIYSASHSGMDAEAFYSRCGDAATFIVVRYRNCQYMNGCIQKNDHIVGGFSDVPWTPSSGGLELIHSPNAFVFSLKHNAPSGERIDINPKRYDLREGHADYAILRGPNLGPSFGAGDLRITFDEEGTATMTTGNGSFEVPDGSSFLKISGGAVHDIEVYRVHHAGEHSMLSASASDAAGMSEEEVNYVRRFGISTANSIMEERAALAHAQVALAKAQHKAAAAVRALEVVYGPDIVAGKKDEVVELSVRGTRVTTLRSTLTVFPDSVFATWFNGNWQPTEKELDEHGRWIVDCSPRVFSKVLDVLRMRKRAGWAVRGRQGEDGGAAAPVSVVVREEDSDCLEEFVNKYFPGRESFIMDLVELPIASTSEKDEA